MELFGARHSTHAGLDDAEVTSSTVYDPATSAFFVPLVRGRTITLSPSHVLPSSSLVVRFRLGQQQQQQSGAHFSVDVLLTSTPRGCPYRIVASTRLQRCAVNSLHIQLPLHGDGGGSGSSSAPPGPTATEWMLSIPAVMAAVASAGFATRELQWRVQRVQVSGSGGAELCSVGLIPVQQPPHASRALGTDADSALLGAPPSVGRLSKAFPTLFFRPQAPVTRLAPSASTYMEQIGGAAASASTRLGRPGTGGAAPALAATIREHASLSVGRSSSADRFRCGGRISSSSVAMGSSATRPSTVSSSASATANAIGRADDSDGVQWGRRRAASAVPSASSRNGRCVRTGIAAAPPDTHTQSEYSQQQQQQSRELATAAALDDGTAAAAAAFDDGAAPPRSSSSSSARSTGVSSSARIPDIRLGWRRPLSRSDRSVAPHGINAHSRTERALHSSNTQTAIAAPASLAPTGHRSSRVRTQPRSSSSASTLTSSASSPIEVSSPPPSPRHLPPSATPAASSHSAAVGTRARSVASDAPAAAAAVPPALHSAARAVSTPTASSASAGQSPEGGGRPRATSAPAADPSRVGSWGSEDPVVAAAAIRRVLEQLAMLFSSGISPTLPQSPRAAALHSQGTSKLDNSGGISTINDSSNAAEFSGPPRTVNDSNTVFSGPPRVALGPYGAIRSGPPVLALSPTTSPTAASASTTDVVVLSSSSSALPDLQQTSIHASVPPIRSSTAAPSMSDAVGVNYTHPVSTTGSLGSSCLPPYTDGHVRPADIHNNDDDTGDNSDSAATTTHRPSVDLFTDSCSSATASLPAVPVSSSRPSSTGTPAAAAAAAATVTAPPRARVDIRPDAESPTPTARSSFPSNWFPPPMHTAAPATAASQVEVASAAAPAATSSVEAASLTTTTANTDGASTAGGGSPVNSRVATARPSHSSWWASVERRSAGIISRLDSALLSVIDTITASRRTSASMPRRHSGITPIAAPLHTSSTALTSLSEQRRALSRSVLHVPSPLDRGAGTGLNVTNMSNNGSAFSRKSSNTSSSSSSERLSASVLAAASTTAPSDEFAVEVARLMAARRQVAQWARKVEVAAQ